MIRRRKLLWLLAVVVVLTVAFVIAFNRFTDHTLARHAFFTTYNWALELYSLDDEPRDPPATILELENDYNNNPARIGHLPRYEGAWPRPEYRPPPPDSSDETYLVLVERKSPFWYDWGTYVSFAKGSGEVTDCRVVDADELMRLLREDEAKRQRLALASTQPSSEPHP